MNVEKINELSNIALALRNLGGADRGTLNRVVELIDKELDAAEPNAQAEEIKALQASNNIKQANLNLLADLAIKLHEGFIGAGQVSRIGLEEMRKLALGVRQEEPNTNEVAYNQRCDQGGAPVDPLAQVVANLKSARAEVLRLQKLRMQTSNDDEDVKDAQRLANSLVAELKETLIKVIDGSIK